ncbi:hypothetical protein [Eisenbergiella porci]
MHCLKGEHETLINIRQLNLSDITETDTKTLSR